MITYKNSGAFGVQMLFRLHGSAVLKSCTPALLSSIIYVCLFEFTDASDDLLLDHPYPVGALVAAFSFLLIFRANFSYNRYWEAYTAIYAMHSKWLDVGTELAAFHLQAACYESVQPPSFGEHSKARIALSPVKRQQNNPMTKEELSTQIDAQIDQDEEKKPSLRSRLAKRKSNSRLLFRKKSSKSNNIENDTDGGNINNNSNATKDYRAQPPAPHRPGHPIRTRTVHFASTMLPGGHRASDFFNSADPHTSFWNHAQERLKDGNMEDAPTPLFLEAVGHLLSLLSAVALSTLRNDLEEAESPLAEFRPNVPWPHVDPDKYRSKIRKGWYRSERRIYTIMRYLLGLSRTDHSRILYNKGRPFRVIGNVTDKEIQALQAARGPQAKVTLISFWLQELISREYRHGSTGGVAPPIISRIYQFVSDGMAGYNQARKVAYVPFPFPHAQITTLFVLVIVAIIPLLMLTYIENEFFGFVWNWLTVMCFTGLHEVARELENPFQNVPNEIPLNNYQAQFNEGLMVMFFGYHPDAFWLDDRETKSSGPSSPTDANRMSSTDDKTIPPMTKSNENESGEHEKDMSSGATMNGSRTTSPPTKRMSRNEPPLQMSSLEDTMLVANESIEDSDSPVVKNSVQDDDASSFATANDEAVSTEEQSANVK